MSDLHVVSRAAEPLNTRALAERLHVAPDSSDYQDLSALAHEAEALARPRACYRLAYIDGRGEDHVVVDGVTLASRVLRVNLEEVHRLFAEVATCGTEVDAWAHGLQDILWQYWAEAIKEALLRQAIKALREDEEAAYGVRRTSTMAPGSLADWPIREQRPLFRLLGDVESAIGVRLSESMLMSPNKSTSGVRFETESDFVSCALCPRDVCPGRRAPYDATLYERRYRRA